MSRIEIINAHQMRLSHLFPTTHRGAVNALSMPTPDGQGTETLFQNGLFPSRCFRRLLSAIGPTDTEWKCPKPPVYGRMGHLVDKHADMVKEFGLRGQYQEEGIRKLLDHMGGILNSAAGSGKTRMAAFAIRLLMEAFQEAENCPPLILWVAQTREQVDQAKDALKFVGIPSNARFLKVCCWQGLDTTDDGKHFIDNCDILVMDECHSASDSLHKIASKCLKAWWRFGLTATAVRTDNRELLLEAMFGQKVAVIDQARVQDEGHLLRGHAVVYPVGEKDDLIAEVEAAAAGELAKLEAKNCSQEFYQDQKKKIMYRHARQVGILNSDRRNNLIISIAHDLIDQGKRILIIVGSKEQGRYIRDAIAGSKLVYSAMPVKEGRREEIMEEARAGKIQCMIATSLADQGLDIPCLDVIVMAAGGKGGKNGYLVEQRAARGQRVAAGKTVGMVVDFDDRGYGALKFQSVCRITKYKEMRFTMDRNAAQEVVA